MVKETIPVHGISKLWLEVRQLGRAIHFYRDVLRLPLVGLDGDIAFFDVDGQQIALTEPQVFGDGSVAGALCHWALAVEGAESDWYARKVRESGGRIYPIPWGHSIDDPDANLGELWTGSAWPHSRRGPRWGEEISPAAAQRPPSVASGFTVRAVRGPSLLEVRRGSATGRVLFHGTLEKGEAQRFNHRRLWLNIGSPENLRIKLNGQPASLGTGCPQVVVVTPTQVTSKSTCQ